MTPEQFVYWLQGFVEIREKESTGLSEREWNIITDHLKTVFHKVTPTETIGGQDTQPVPFPPYPIDPGFFQGKIIC